MLRREAEWQFLVPPLKVRRYLSIECDWWQDMDVEVWVVGFLLSSY